MKVLHLSGQRCPSQQTKTTNPVIARPYQAVAIIEPVIARPFSGRGDLLAIKQIAGRLPLRRPEKRAAHRNDGCSLAWIIASTVNCIHGTLKLDSSQQTKPTITVIARPFSGRGDLFVMKQIANRLRPASPNGNSNTIITIQTMPGKGGAVYILTNKNNTTLYVGVTSDLIARITEHKEKFYRSSFTARYNLEKLVYFEAFHSIEEAIDREKQLKAVSRRKKEALINSINPDWNDLFPTITEQW